MSFKVNDVKIYVARIKELYTHKVQKCRKNPACLSCKIGIGIMDKLIIQDISELPEGQPLETPLHPKRIPKWKLSPKRSPKVKVSPSAREVPSPAKLTKREDATSVLAAPGVVGASPPLTTLQYSPSPRRLLFRDEDTSDLINYCSKRDSSEDETTYIPVHSRALQSVIETPLDLDFCNAEEPTPIAALDVASTETYQPWSLFDFEWKPFPNPPIPPESRRETFSQINVGPTTPKADPYDIFIDIWDRPLMEHIVSETNKYAQQMAAQMHESNTLSPNSSIGQWVDTTVDELYVFFGLLLAMGLVIKIDVEEYWATDCVLTETPRFGETMSLNRFKILSKCLHFNDNKDMCALELDSSNAKLFKIKPILSHLNKKFQEMYIPGRNIALDKSLLMWKGSLDINQINQNKAAGIGIKSYEICESETGYLWRFQIYAPDRAPPRHDVDYLAASIPSIVLRLTRGLEYKGYTLWMDNYYNSPCLARHLKSIGFDVVGPLSTDRKFVPQTLHDLAKDNMRSGQNAGLTSGDVDVMVCRYYSRVAMISTYHGNDQSTIRGTTKPTVLWDYKNMMGGLDKKDQRLAKYPIERKKTKEWYKKLFTRLLNVSVLNAYVIHCHNSTPPLSHYEFRGKLVDSLLSKHWKRSPSTVPSMSKPANPDR